MGHIYQQTVIDTYSKIGFAKLYDRKNALVAADMLNDRVIPFFEQHDLKLMRMLTDRGTEYCGNRENHEYELYLAVEDIDHSKIKAKSPQTNGICERFNRTVQNEFYAIAFRKKIYTSIEQLQAIANYETADLKARLTEKLLHIIDETSTAKYTDRRGTELSPAPLRSVAVQASKALMEMYPVKVAQESKVELKGNGDSGIVFNVIVPQSNNENSVE